jgi:hypothetical protein
MARTKAEQVNLVDCRTRRNHVKKPCQDASGREMSNSTQDHAVQHLLLLPPPELTKMIAYQAVVIQPDCKTLPIALQQAEKAAAILVIGEDRLPVMSTVHDVITGRVGSQVLSRLTLPGSPPDASSAVWTIFVISSEKTISFVNCPLATPCHSPEKICRVASRPRISPENPILL